MVEYSKLNAKLADTQLKKLKPAVKNKTGTTLSGTTAAVSAIDAGIQKKINGSGTITLIITNVEINDMDKWINCSSPWRF